MLTISIPGFRDLHLEHLVLDYNGTLACDGELLRGVKQALETLAEHVRIHVVTADTFGRAAAQLADVPDRMIWFPATKMRLCSRRVSLFSCRA